MSEISIDELEAEVGSNPLVAVDRTLQALSRCKKSETSELMEFLSEAILTHLEEPVPDDPVTGLFDQALSQRDRRFIGICLARLLAVNEAYFQQDHNFRVKAFALFDDVLEEDVYEELGITRRQQTYMKSMRLRDAAPEAESMMGEVVDSLISLDRLGGFREQFMRALETPLVKAVMTPFLPRSLLYKSRLGEVFDALGEYRQASVSTVLEAFEHANEVVGQYLTEAQSCDTLYCQRYLVEMAERLHRLLKEDLSNSDVGRPTELEVRPLNKKYPFHQVGQDITLGFVVENHGPGYAFGVELSASSPFDNVVVRRPTLRLGRLEPGSLIVAFPARVTASEEIALIQVGVTWHNADGSRIQRSLELELEGQRTDINWEDLELEDPYSLEPVETHDQLVGRKEIIDQLVRQSRARSIGSSYILGQKRVGKTSIAKALRSRLSEDDDFLVIYMEGGEYIGADPVATLNRIGAKLCEKVKKSTERLADLAIPNFDGALYPLADFLESVHDAIHALRILFILDEFDEIPVELFRRGPLADAFFLTLRTISGKPYCGFVLVGGERMDFIKSCQGDTFNKFQEIRVDYFDREEHWADFQALMRRPTEEWLEITDDAVIALYEQTSGNPYFTMCICRELFAAVLRKRDCFVTAREVTEEAVPLALQHVGTGFYHFWEDGIFEATGDRVEEVSIRRRRILLALANVLRNRDKASIEDIVAQDVVRADLDQFTLESELRRFVQRGILVEDNGLYDCKVPMFRAWLESFGVKEILTTFTDLDAILERRQREEEAYVRSDEIVDLFSEWGLYQGKRITEDHVRAWLQQFDDYVSQRLMFKVLQGLRFYSDDQMRAKMREAHGIVRRGLVRRIEKGKRKRGDILISYLDGPGKSGGGKYAKLYADENGIYYKNVVERSKLAEVVSQREDLQALVFVDDFIGTGESAQTYFKRLAKESGQVLQESGLKIYFIVVTGFQEGQSRVEETIAECNLAIEVHICDPLDSSAKCFSEDSQIFPNETERLQAMRIAQEHGACIVKHNPLGYGDCQTAIVFPDNCPNNNLPILWAESDEPPWRPLFRRPMPRKQML